MNELLKLISERAIELADFDFTQEQTKNKWLGTLPASEDEIKLTEKRLGIELPADFKLFLSITNGFSAPNDIEPTFVPISKIDFLKNFTVLDTNSFNVSTFCERAPNAESKTTWGMSFL